MTSKVKEVCKSISGRMRVREKHREPRVTSPRNVRDATARIAQKAERITAFHKEGSHRLKLHLTRQLFLLPLSTTSFLIFKVY